MKNNPAFPFNELIKNEGLLGHPVSLNLLPTINECYCSINMYECQLQKQPGACSGQIIYAVMSNEAPGLNFFKYSSLVGMVVENVIPTAFLQVLPPNIQVFKVRLEN